MGTRYCEDVLDRFVLNPVWGGLFDHPLDDRFSARDFQTALHEAGLKTTTVFNLWNLFLWVIAEKPSI